MADVDGVNLKITADTSSAVKDVEQVTKATEELKDAAQNIEVKVDGKMDALGKLHKANGQFMTMGEKMADKFNSGFMKGFAKLAPAIDKAGQKIADVTGKIDRVINKSVLAVTAAIGYLTKNALSLGGGFEAQMTNVKIISSATTDELNALIKKAREMGATLPITAKDAAEAMELLAQRGTKAKDILATVADVSALTISQQIDMATSADLLGTTMTNFGLSVEDASKITDIFNNASNQSAMNISKLVAAMKYVGPAAGSLEIPLEKTVALMEAAANAGLTGEMIGTGLSMVFTKIASNAHIMGVSTRNLDGSLRDMADIFSDLAKKGMDAGQANTFFGVRAGKTAIALIKNAEQLKQNEENLQKWGATQTAVQEKMKTWPNVWNAFISATEELNIEIFDQIKNQSKDAVFSLTDFTRIFSDWVNKTQAAGKAFSGFFQGLGFDALKNIDIRYLLDKIDVDAIAKKFESLGYFFQYTANTFKTIYEWIKTPLLFLIDHLTAFSVINFWTWLAGKGATFATTLVSIASGFNKLFFAIKAFTGIDIALILTNPITLFTAAATAAAGTIIYFVNKADDARKKLREQQQEIKQANFDAEYDFQFNMKTGFEELPEAWNKANEETKEALRTQKLVMQEDFIGAYERAVDYVKEKMPEYAKALSETGDKVNETVLKQISDFLHGNIKEFYSLPEYLKPVAERLHTTFYIAGDHNLEIYRLRDSLEQVRLLRLEADELAKQDPAERFSQNISTRIKDMFLDINSAVERAKKLLGNEQFDFILNVSFSEAKSKLDEFIKTTAKDFDVPEDIVKKATLNQLKELAAQGHKTAQSLINGWDGATYEIDLFLDKAHGVINYLNVAPDKFLPALNSMAQGVQKIDPITGKVTEQFKKLRDEIKQLANTSFDQFTQRIQKIKKAVEGGFIDKSALEREFNEALARVSVQVQTELQPTKDSYKNQRDYESVVASEVYSRLAEIGGDTFAEKLKQKFNGQTGDAMGHAILAQLQKGFDNQVVMKVDGVDKLNNFAIDTQQVKDVFNPFVQEIQKVDFATPAQQVTNALNSFSNKISNINVNVPTQDFSGAFAPIINKLNNLDVKINSQDFVQAVNSLAGKLDNIEIKIATQELNNAIDAFGNKLNSFHISFDTTQLTDALSAFGDNLQNIDLQVQAQSQINDYSALFGQVIDEIRTLNNSVGAVENAIRAVNISVPANSNETINIDFSGVITAIQTLGQSNSGTGAQIISAINSLNAGETNTYNINIQQEGFNIQKKSDADSLAKTMTGAIQVGLGNGGV